MPDNSYGSYILKATRKIGGYPKGFINYFRDSRHISIQKSGHTFWMTYYSHPPVPYTLQNLARLCHFFNHVPEDNAKPYIIEYEHVLMMSRESLDYVYMINSVDKIEKQLLSRDCRGIIVPTEGAFRETRRYIRASDVWKKVHVIHPAYPSQPDNHHIHHGPFTILTIGNKFWGKGIPLAIEVFRILRERYGKDVQMNLVSGDIPLDYPLPEGLDVLYTPMLTEDVRTQLYRKAHVFILPCLHDSYGVYQEAMAYGVPIIATRIYDKEELILDGQTGFLVDTPISLYDGDFGVEWKSWNHFQEIVKAGFEGGLFEKVIDNIVAKTELLMHDLDLVRQMGHEAQKLQRREFSIEARNRKIKQLYDKVIEAL